MPDDLAAGFVRDGFVLHAAQRHRGTLLRFMAQAAIEPADPVDPDAVGRPLCPVKEAIRAGLGGIDTLAR